MFPAKAFAFLKRDFLENASYKAASLLDSLNILSNIVIFFFISKLVQQSSPDFAEAHGSSYFAFVLAGLALSGYQLASLRAFADTIAREQSAGTLEAILVTRTSLYELIAAGSLWQFVWATLRVVIYLVLGAVFFRLDLSAMNMAAVLVSVILTLSSLLGLGFISAGYLIAFKRGDPVIVILNSLSKLFAGVYFPVTLLPDWVQTLSQFFPLTHSLNALRRALFQGSGLNELSGDFGALALFSIVLIPAGMLFFQWSVRKAKREGSLVFS